MGENENFWFQLFTKVFTKKYICVLGRPNEKYVDDINHEVKFVEFLYRMSYLRTR